MAVTYTQNITLADILSKMESWNDVNDKIQMDKLFTILIAEFAVVDAAVTTVDDYVMTTTLRADLEGTLLNVSNALRVEFLKNWIDVLITEFTAVVDDGLTYTVTTNATFALEELIDHLNRATYCIPDNQKKISLQAINALIVAEFELIELAAA
jgi:hypothetical protein